MELPRKTTLKLSQPMSRRELLAVFLLLLTGLTYLFPELMLLQKAPMSGDPWTLKDPTVSWTAFYAEFSRISL